MTNLIIQDSKRRKLVQKYEQLRRELKSIFYNLALPETVRKEAYLKLNQLPRNSSSVRVRNRCIITGRGRATYQEFKLSRLSFRELASSGHLPGVKKSSW